MINKKNFPGMDGFVWFTGIVEDRNDPLKNGRVLVRIFGWHTDNKQHIPTEGLTWAQQVFGVNTNQITHVPREGEMVFGFFIDGESAQFPFILGVIPNIPEIQYPDNVGFSDPGTNIDERPITLHSGQTRYPAENELNQPSTSRSARNENMDQTPYKAAHAGRYPYVFSIQSESGHYIDLDDTPGAERITVIHRNGSRIDINTSGNVDLYSIGDINITAGGNINISASSIVNKAGTIDEDTPAHKTTGVHTDANGLHIGGSIDAGTF